MNMEFLRPNFANTTTMFTLDCNTAGAAFLFDRRPQRQYKTIGWADDTTQTSIRIAFPNTVSVDHIVFQNFNFKQFTIYYGGVTASTFALTTTAGTSASAWTAFSGTDLYLVLASITAITSMSIDVKKTQVANQEKSVGQVIVSSRLYQFTRNPNNSGFTPKVNSKESNHDMSDGGMISYRIREKLQYDLNVAYDDDRAALRTVYDLNTEMYYAPFPTCTSWNGDAFEVVWVGGFNVGRKPSTNYTLSGYEKTIKLQETPS